MDNSPFVNQRFLLAMNAEAVDALAEADAMVFRRMQMLDKVELDPAKIYLLWTHEPFVNDEHRTRIRAGKPDVEIHVFNAHNGLIYTDNYLYAGGRDLLPDVEAETDLNVPFADKTVAVAATHRNWPLKVGGVERSLNELRGRIAIELHAQGMARVIGRNWPQGIAIDDTRNVDRNTTKNAFLKGANFNLCPENSSSDYYVTEKIWDCIQGGCLPVYYGNGTIHQVFPRDSFIDLKVFKTGKDLGDFISAMTFEEYCGRINACRHVLNHARLERLRAASWNRTVARITTFFDSYCR
ncbi:MAG: glycosyltransferase family 10 domain-containing protein [Aestuariivirga sp.]